jgi:hypothetical protein
VLGFTALRCDVAAEYHEATDHFMQNRLQAVTENYGWLSYPSP